MQVCHAHQLSSYLDKFIGQTARDALQNIIKSTKVLNPWHITAYLALYYANVRVRKFAMTHLVAVTHDAVSSCSNIASSISRHCSGQG